MLNLNYPIAFSHQPHESEPCII